jgi:hypothetical protein
VSGPYETEQEAVAAIRHIYETPAELGAVHTPNLRLLLDACADAGVMVGTYDVRILEWLANYEPATSAVVAGLITRAHESGQDAAGGPGTAQRGGGWISGPST